MLGKAHYYNRSIRKIVVAFGTLFNDLYIKRYNKAGTTAFETFRVPLSSAQNFYIDMPTASTATTAVTFAYTDIQNKLSYESS